MRKLITIGFLFQVLLSCDKADLIPDSMNTIPKKEYPKDVAIIETQIFLKDKSRYEYYSSNKSVFGENDQMSLIIIQDTLREGDYLSINLFSQSYHNEMVYKIVCWNKKQVLAHDSCYSYSIQKFIPFISDYLIEK